MNKVACFCDLTHESLRQTFCRLGMKDKFTLHDNADAELCNYYYIITITQKVCSNCIEKSAVK